jgi:hypothetical protein
MKRPNQAASRCVGQLVMTRPCPWASWQVLTRRWPHRESRAAPSPSAHQTKNGGLGRFARGSGFRRRPARHLEMGEAAGTDFHHELAPQFKKVAGRRARCN